MAALRGLQSLLGGNGLDFGDPSDSGSTGHIIQYGLIALLLAAAIRNYVRRETIEPPKWLGKLQEAGPKQALANRPARDHPDALGPDRDAHRGHQPRADGDSLAAAVPFILLTTLIAALPLLGFLIFHRRALRAMPKVRDWMNTNSWLVNIIVCAIFIVLIL